MAFPVPSHLPRRASPQDVSSKIHSKIDSVTYETLDSAQASSWLAELEDTIQSTKQRIHDRIQGDLPDFQRQLQSSQSVQTRLQTLTTNVDTLGDTVSNSQTGLIPTLVDNLTKHAALAQESIDGEVKTNALSHLIKCRNEYESLNSLVQAGKLPEAVHRCTAMDVLIEEAPKSLKQAAVMEDLKRKFRAMKALAEEQLSDAYSRSINVLPLELVVHSTVQVRQSEATLTLPSILSSLSSAALSNHLATLRRDLTSHFIDYVLKQPTSLTIGSSNASEHRLSLIPSPPNTEIRTTRLDNVAEVLGFLSTQVFSAFPEAHKSEFTRSLSKPVASSILNSLIIPSLPSSAEHLPSFLELLRRAVGFEEKCLIGMLGNESDHRMINEWADGASGHYERQRRDQILVSSRVIITSPEDTSDRFPVEIELVPEAPLPTVVPVQVEEAEEVEDDAWGFDDESGKDNSIKDLEDSWGLDDNMGAEPEEPTTHSKPELKAEEQPPEPDAVNGDEEPDPADAWGWNDDDVEMPEDDAAEQSAWDDPWADPPASTSSNSSPESPTVPTPPVASPKAATRLEKLASKHKKHLNGSSPANSSPSLSLPPSEKVSPIPPAASAPAPGPTKKVETRHTRRPSKLTASVAPKEVYFVSGRTKRIIKMVEDVLAEGKQFTASKLFLPSRSDYSSGSILLQSAPSILDLYRALYPVKFGKELESSERGMIFSNDCLYMSGEVERIEHVSSLSDHAPSKERLLECQRYLKVLSDSWFDDTIERQRQAVDKTLSGGTQGFTYTGDQDRYDECESAMGEVLRDIRRFAQKLKGILAKSKYYTAIGLVADAALSRVLADILALPDIPELESHKLSELCRIFNALEGLFSEDPSQPSFVVAYVPSWLKFSYLSELLEASMADITYLFEESALVDFEVDELVRLVRALFADTALRTTTINKILGGHPVAQQ